LEVKVKAPSDIYGLIIQIMEKQPGEVACLRVNEEKSNETKTKSRL
jgi:hypothetical protein